MGLGQGKITRKTIGELRDCGVNFSEADIKEWYKEYTRSSKAGRRYLTIEEFEELYESLFPGRSRTLAEHMFRVFDKNGDNTLDFKEFLIGLSAVSSLNAESKLKWAFDMYDINGDGKISRPEMTRIILGVFVMAEPGRLQKGVTPEKMAETFFQELDVNGDNEVSWEEFKVGALNNPTIVDVLQRDPSKF